MNLPFGAGLDPGEPLTPETAVRRGHMFVSVPAVALMLGLWVLASRVMPSGGSHPTFIEAALVVFLVLFGPVALGWCWWSYFIPRWRDWALSQGVDSEELQQVAQRSGLVWRRDQFFSRTEFRYRPPKT